MADFKFVIADRKKGKTYQTTVPVEKAAKILGKKIGDKVDGSVADLNGYELEITGGSDRQGFPMRKDVEGAKRIRTLLRGGVGFKPTAKGQRRRKSIRGKEINKEVSQINCVVIKYGAKPLEEIFGKTEAEAKEAEAKLKSLPKGSPPKGEADTKPIEGEALKEEKTKEKKAEEEEKK